LTGRDDDAPHRIAEHASFVLSALVVAAVVGCLLYFAVAPEYAAPPRMVIEQDGAVRRAGDQWYVAFEIRNQGGRPADGVRVEATLSTEGQVERATQEFDYVAGSDRRRGAFVFDHDPAHGELELRVVSLRVP